MISAAAAFPKQNDLLSIHVVEVMLSISLAIGGYGSLRPKKGGLKWSIAGIFVGMDVTIADS